MSEPLGTGLEESPDRHGAFPRLTEEQLASVREIGEQRTVTTGELLFREGDEGYDFFVVESGAVAIVRGYGSEDHVIAVHGPGRFLGELNLLTGGGVFLTAVVRDPGEVIQVPISRLFALLARDQDFANLVLSAYLARRSLLIEIGGGSRVVGSRYSRDARRLREFLARNRVPYQWIDLEDRRRGRGAGPEPAWPRAADV
jgi:thioredoxin reductase (NADPH)